MQLDNPVQVTIGASRGTTSYIANFSEYSEAILNVVHESQKRFMSTFLLALPHWALPVEMQLDREGKIVKISMYDFMWEDRYSDTQANEKFKLCLTVNFGTQALADRFSQTLNGKPNEITYGVGIIDPSGPHIEQRGIIDSSGLHRELVSP